MSIPLRGAAQPLEVLAAGCAAFNLLFFVRRSASPGERPARRAAALAMALISLGVLGEATLIAAGGAEVPGSIRFPVVMGTVLVTALVARRMAVGR